MKVLENTLELVIERWTDPGDYPSNAGQGPLPSHDFVADITGHVLVQLEKYEDLIDFSNWLEGDNIDTPKLECQYCHLPEGVSVLEWDGKFLDNWNVYLTVKDFEG
jgi:hypothetical protein